MSGKLIRKFLVYLICSFMLFTISGCSLTSDVFSTESKNEIKEVKNEEEKDIEIKEDYAESELKTDEKEEEVIPQVNDTNTKEVNEETASNENKQPKKVVVIDPGHANRSNLEKEKQSPDSNIMKIKDGGGAEGIVTKTPEYVVCMSVSKKLKTLLEQNNIMVIMTKTSDSESLGNIERANIGNDNNADLVIRIHCDSAENQSASGASMLVPAKTGYAVPISDISKNYGQTILNSLVETCQMKNRGVVERSDMTGFNWSKVPVVLVEMGFMSNPNEDRLLNDEGYQNKLAQGLCNGILSSLK